MTPLATAEEQLVARLRLPRRPVALATLTSPPDGVPKFEGQVPSSCSFWRLAADGATFYTVAPDHFNCPVGSYTHGYSLPPDRAGELDTTLGLMTELGYLRMAEVPGIPRLESAPDVIVYAPLASSPVAPDVVIVSGPPSAVMRLQEAALRAQVAGPAPLLGRPTCMAIPAALAQGLASSLGCIGNRVYTDLGDDELYVALAGRTLHRVIAELDTIETANEALRAYHQARRATLATG
ncbi:MAG: hypothetical protein FJW23_13625 [Acidimicrobiia bacterium]|nr:hypothetical protein [Acidimicrobiia bacterium]